MRLFTKLLAPIRTKAQGKQIGTSNGVHCLHQERSISMTPLDRISLTWLLTFWLVPLQATTISLVCPKVPLCGSYACWMHNCHPNLRRNPYMKETNPSGKIDPGNLARVQKNLKGYTPPSQYEGLLCLLADVVDTALAGRTCYLTFGLSRSQDLIMMTITNGGSKLYASGVTLEELAGNCKDLI